MQRVVLNGQTSSWKNILAGVPEDSILGPLFFLVYINYIPDGLESIVKIFSDDTSLFKVLFDYIISSSVLDNDLRLIANWALSGKCYSIQTLQNRPLKLYSPQKESLPSLQY